MSLKNNPLALSLALILSLGAGAADAASVALPERLPPLAADKPLPVPQIARKTLANGLEVWVVPRQGLPRVDYVLTVRNAGHTADPSDAPGFASLYAGLLVEGTAKRDAKAVAEAAQGYGGTIGASALNDGVALSGDALASQAAPMLQLIAEVAQTPSFPDAEVQLAKTNALQSLKVSQAQPAYKATRALSAAVYGDHPYARTQLTEASINAVTAEKVRAEHARRFRPDRALLVIAGRISAEQGFKLAEAAFGGWKASGEPVADAAPARTSAPVQRIFVQRDGSVQSAVRLGRPGLAATSPDYVPAQLAGIVLGGGFSSRLMQNLREDKGYTYGARGGISAMRAGGAVQAAADVRNEVTGASLGEFIYEFGRLNDYPVPAQELEDTKRYVAGGYLINNQQQGSVASSLATNWLIGLPAEFLGEYVPKIRAVDAAQVQAMAKKYYAAKDQSIIVVGDYKAVESQLKEFGEFKQEK
ncbi:insulinase family protein [Lysobacter sp. K5869]|uniref:M16 family metallopeptidase n=1 Tax=Lysobacter sp. K5869 TaxID=2820808 RepID=UPI001C06088A|nr:pitrilysin family protein [Lysobacter sp. K5869]QWP76315.1 insulinase family protein [Lysobacter sp. K5869]